MAFVITVIVYIKVKRKIEVRLGIMKAVGCQRVLIKISGNFEFKLETTLAT
jgi:hypothetical protein